MALNDIYKITLFQEYVSQQMLNVWWYVVTGGSGNTAANLASPFIGQVVNFLADIQHPDVEYVRLLVQNVTNTSDNHEVFNPGTGSGAGLGTPTPLRLAMSFRSNRPNLAERFSFKRFGGIDSNFLTGSDWTVIAGAPVTLATNMASILANAGDFYSPAQVHIQPPPGGGTPAYSINYIISSWLALAEPSTQNSRAFGRGI